MPSAKLVHGYRSKKHPIYNVWRRLRQRCDNPNNPDYRYYGGRGITYCDRWKDFKNFAEDMFPTWREGLSIDRRDNDKGYSPKNCRWATPYVQVHNRRSLRNKSTGEKYIYIANGRFRVCYCHGKNAYYDLGCYSSVVAAKKVRDRFIVLYETGDEAYKDMIRTAKNRQGNFNAKVGIKGISPTEYGFQVTKTHNGKRLYLGHATTLEKAIAILEAANERR